MGLRWLPQRLRGWWFVALLAVGLGAQVVRVVEPWDRQTGSFESRRDGRRSQAYVLPNSDSGVAELQFPIPPRAKDLRILTTGLIDPKAAPPLNGWTYSLELEMGSVLPVRKQHFRSRPTEWLGPEQQPEYSLSAIGLESEKLVPLDSRTARFKLADRRNPSTLSLRLASVEPGVERIPIRVYFREAVAPHRRAVTWPRLSTREREARASGNVYPPELLTDGERDQLMAWKWTPVAPTGLEGRDFERLVLIQHERRGAPLEKHQDVAAGMRVPAGVRIDLPAPPGILRVTRIDVDATKSSIFGGSPLELIEAKEGAGLFALNANTRSVTLKHPAILRLDTSDQDQVEAEAFRAEALRLYGCTSAVTYAVQHLGSPTPLRLDFRTPAGSAGQATLTLLDGAGTTLRSRTVRFEKPLSDLDWLENETPERVSEADRRYLQTSMATAAVRIESCTGDALVATYNRPAATSVERLVPNDGPPTQDWFVLRPQGSEQQESSLLRVQNRPVTNAPRTAAGTSRLVDLRPSSDWDGRHVLLPRARSGGVAQAGSVAQGARTSYVKLKGGTQQLTFAAARAAERNLEPRLLFRRSGTGPFRLRVRVDDVPVLDEEWAGRQGEVLLPPMTSGRHTIEVDADADLFLGNVLAEPATTAYVRRLTFRTADSFSIQWIHDGEGSLISGRLFTSGSPQQCTVRATAALARRAGSLSRRYSFPTRRWIFTTRAQQDTVALLGSDELTSQRSAPFFFSIGDDVPRGSVTLRYSVDCPGQTYMTASMMREAADSPSVAFRERQLP